MEIKKADFAGSWYPGSSSGCEEDIREFLSSPGFRAVPEKTRVAGIVPHAGWYFSGALACQVIRRLAHGDKPDVVVLFGKHMRPREQPDIMAGGWFETPLGMITKRSAGAIPSWRWSRRSPSVKATIRWVVRAVSRSTSRKTRVFQEEK